jgi:hypothetical protein
MPQSFYVPEGTNGTAFTQDDHNLEKAGAIDGLPGKTPGCGSLSPLSR